MLHLLSIIYVMAFNGFPHDLMSGLDLTLSFLVPGNIEIIQSIFDIPSSRAGLVIQSTHWPTLYVCHTSPSQLIQASSYLQSKWTTSFLELIKIYWQDLLLF